MRKKRILNIILIIGFVLLAFFIVTCRTTPLIVETAESHNKRGNELAEKNDWQYAYMAYTKAIEIDPNFSDAYFGRGRANISLNKPREAISDFSKAIELAPQGLGAYFNRGLMYKHLGNVQAYTNVFGYPTNTVGTSNVSELTRALEYYTLALSDYNKALESTNSNVQQRASVEIAEVQKKKGEVETALGVSTAQTRARTEATQRSRENLIFGSSDFSPVGYTNADLFAAVAASERLQAYLEPGTYEELDILGVYSRKYASDVVFVSQNGTDIVFKTEDNAISKSMKVDSRTGLTVGQKVRIYYTAYRIRDWRVEAIERL